MQNEKKKKKNSLKSNYYKDLLFAAPASFIHLHNANCKL